LRLVSSFAVGVAVRLAALGDGNRCITAFAGDALDRPWASVG